MAQSRVRAVYMRGGTSRCLAFHDRDLPQAGAERDHILLAALGSPDPYGRQLDGIGVSRDAYDGIVSSGDVSRSLIEGWAGRPIFHIGPERDLPIFAGLQAQPGANADDADVAVCTGLYEDETETPENYTVLLEKLRARNVPMICANRWNIRPQLAVYWASSRVRRRISIQCWRR